MKPYSPPEKQSWWTPKKALLIIVGIVLFCGVFLQSQVQQDTDRTTTPKESADSEFRDAVRRWPSEISPSEPVSEPTPSVGIRNASQRKMVTVYLGMKDTDVYKLCGPPLDINKTVGSWGVHEQWIYAKYVYGYDRKYLYFENGYLTSWQE